MSEAPKTFDQIKPAQAPLIGLALSGGGIRSATFNLGVLQGLARRRLLHRVDVLSTVSGGGYIGAWLLALIHEKKKQGSSSLDAIHEVERELAPDRSGDPTANASKPVRFLRQYSNYLTPETGFFSKDSWAMASIWLRNTVLNQMILVPLVAVVLLVPRIFASILPGSFGNPWNVTVLGPLLFVGVFSFIITLLVGLVGRYLSDESLEYLGRVGAIFNMIVVGWALVSSIAVYGPLVVVNLAIKFGLWVHTLTVGWIASTVSGLLTGKSSSSGGNASKAGVPSGIAYWISSAAPYVFVVGLLFVASYWLNVLFVYFGLMSLAPSLPKSADGFFWPTVMLTIALLGIALIFARTVDINDFSMHNLYKNRLVRCYLGASRSSDRKPNWVGMDRHDDFPLSDLENYRPYPIINTTLNLVHGDELAWQERKGESFVFSTDYCGFERPPLPSGDPRRGGFRFSKEYASGVSLGTAFVTSGAAINPSWGYHSSPATTFLMALFNIRLGQWFGNPIHDKWKEHGPKTFLYWLIELLGYTNDKRDFVNLTDGGHFENLGIYELVRRECRFIIASDAGEDHLYAFEDLGSALRKCRTDFGAKIEIQTGMIRPDPKTGSSTAHCAVGRIEYKNGSRGYLLYLKATLTGDEPDDVLQYHRSHPEFPHQSTADQWFDESQFESYRMLGLHEIDSVLETSFRNVNPNAHGISVTVGHLFRDLYEAWYPPSQFIRDSFTKHTAAFDQLMERLRKDNSLKLIPNLYPAMRAVYEPTVDADSANTFLLCNALIQLMENVYIDLHLDEPEQLAHPHNQGWIRLFKQWSASGAFRNAWKVSAPTFGKRFRDFCHRELDLPKAHKRDNVEWVRTLRGGA